MNGILSEGECSMVLLMRRVCFVSFFVLMMIFSGSLIIAQEIQGIQGGWDYASEFEKEILLKGVIDAKIKSIKGIVGTEWQDDLLVKGDIKFDPKNVPENVVSIEFTEDEIIYGFENGVKIASVVPLGIFTPFSKP